MSSRMKVPPIAIRPVGWEFQPENKGKKQLTDAIAAATIRHLNPNVLVVVQRCALKRLIFARKRVDPRKLSIPRENSPSTLIPDVVAIRQSNQATFQPLIHRL